MKQIEHNTNKNMKEAISYILYKKLAATQTEIAGMVDTSKGNLSSFANGLKPTPERIANMFESVYGISAKYILGQSNEMFNEKEIKKALPENDKAFTFLLQEIAGIKANIKGTLFSDELKALMTEFSEV